MRHATSLGNDCCRTEKVLLPIASRSLNGEKVAEAYYVTFEQSMANLYRY